MECSSLSLVTMKRDSTVGRNSMQPNTPRARNRIDVTILVHGKRAEVRHIEISTAVSHKTVTSSTNRSSLRGFHGAFAGEEMTSELRWYNHISYLVGHVGSESLRGAAVSTLAAEIKRLTKREIGGKLWNKLLVLEDFIRGAADGTTRFPSLLSSGSRTSADHQQTWPSPTASFSFRLTSASRLRGI